MAPLTDEDRKAAEAIGFPPETLDYHVRQTELAEKLHKEQGLPEMTALIVAGDLMSAERATAEVNAGRPAEQAYILVGSYARWQWVLDMLAQGALTEEWFAKNVADLWRGSDPDDENPAYLAVWQRLFALHGITRDGRPLPKGGSAGLLKVYRGGSPFSVKKGFAWTLDPKIARKFANGAGVRVKMANGVVVTGLVRPTHVLAYLTGRGESEVIVDPRLITDIHPLSGREEKP